MTGKGFVCSPSFVALLLFFARVPGTNSTTPPGRLSYDVFKQSDGRSIH